MREVCWPMNELELSQREFCGEGFGRRQKWPFLTYFQPKSGQKGGKKGHLQ
jgi:hypothetical protein